MEPRNTELLRYVNVRRVTADGSRLTTTRQASTSLHVRSKAVEKMGTLRGEDAAGAKRQARQVLGKAVGTDPAVSALARLARQAKSRGASRPVELKKRAAALLAGDDLDDATLRKVVARAGERLAAARTLGMHRDEPARIAEDAIRGAEILRKLQGGSARKKDIEEIALSPIVLQGGAEEETSDDGLVETKSAMLVAENNFFDFGMQEGKLFEGLIEDTDDDPVEGWQIQKRLHDAKRYITYQNGMIEMKSGSGSSSDDGTSDVILQAGSDGAPTTVGEARILGVGELILVRETLSRYEYAEIAHIENVLKSEKRLRQFAVETTTEDEETRIVEENEMSRNDLTTFDRSELVDSITSVLTSLDTSRLSAGMTVKYGPVKAHAGAGMTSTTGSTVTTTKSSTFGREVTETAAHEVSTSKRRETRSLTRVVRSEQNEHGFDNSIDPDGHIVGIYRYLDKVTTAQAYTYGARLFLEFVVPEPAAVMIHALLNATPAGMSIVEPAPFDVAPEGITADNYLDLAAQYGAMDVSPPPPDFLQVPHTIDIKPADESDYPIPSDDTPDPDKSDPYYTYFVGDKKIPIPAGYEPMQVTGHAVFGNNRDITDDDRLDERERYDFIRFSFGPKYMYLNNVSSLAYRLKTVPDLTDEDLATKPSQYHGVHQEGLPIAWAGKQKLGIAVTITVNCRRRPEHLNQWRMETWSRINAAYEAQNQAYQNEMARAFSFGTTDFGANSAGNRQTERAELKRGAISFLTDQQFETFGSVTFTKTAPPLVNLDEAREEGEFIRFFESAVEWEHMTYQFYSYAWADRRRWVELMSRKSNDPLHQEFLRAGAARVKVPVAPGYEVAILRYMHSGDIWDGVSEQDPPKTEEAEDIINDLAAAPQDMNEELVDDPWEIRTATNLVILQMGPDPNNPEPVA